jgi:hypothetical protein
MKTPTEKTQVTSERVKAIAESLGIYEDDYANRGVALFNRYSFYGRRSGYEVLSEVRTARRWRSKRMHVLLRERETDEEITTKLRKLQARAEKAYREQRSEEEADELREKEYAAQEKAAEKVWVGAVRCAFGNAPDQPLEGATLPKVLTKEQLLKARVSEDLTIKLPPLDPFLKDKDKVDQQRTLRAGFLAELDRLLASYKNEVLAS